MKRALATFLTTVYAVLSMGLVLHVHYCGGELAHVSILAEEASCCESSTDCCATQIHCCENKEIRIAIDEVHQSTFGVQIPQFSELFTAPSIRLICQQLSPVLSIGDVDSRGSPPGETPIYLSLCRLTYYG